MLVKNCLICNAEVVVRAPSRYARTKTCSALCRQKWAANRSGILSNELARLRRHVPRQPLDHRLVPLTMDGECRVDIEDYEFAMRLNWCLTDSGYARRTNKGTNERLHRLVMERVLGRDLEAHERVDHVNGDRLDNRRGNLRIATDQENSINSRRRNALGFRGVEKGKSKSLSYMARIMIDDTCFTIGTFDTPEEAAWMYDQYALVLHGDFASLNFDYA